jgi:hypothetical protein
MDAAGGMIAMPRSFRADKAVGWNKPERAARGRSKGTRAKGSAHSRSKSGKSSASKSSKSKSSSVSKGAKKHVAPAASRKKSTHKA